MNRNISIQLKAAFLLIVFGLNTMVGFACAMGVDMEFNVTHHHDEEATEVHSHADEKRQAHHDESAKHHDHEKSNTTEKKGCCNDDVQKFQSLDKNLNQNAKIAIDAPALAAIISAFLVFDVYNLSKAYPPKYKVRFFYPPPPDIRIIIQSFQI